MCFPCCGFGSVSSGKTKTRPGLSRSQTTSSVLQRSIQNSKLLSGPLPPGAKNGLTPEQILDLTFWLSKPVDTPLLTSKIAHLKAPLSRPERSSPSHCLCDVHTWFEIQWINDLTVVIGEEIGPRLKRLREAPDELRSAETDKVLRRLKKYTHVYSAEDPQVLSMENLDQCDIRGCKICSPNSCRACRLSNFFQNAKAVEALSICAKGRKMKKREWPEVCAWLDPKPGCGWAFKWKKEGLTISMDRFVVQQWSKTGRKERLTKAVTDVQAKARADKTAMERELDIRLSTQSQRVTDKSVYEEIIERDWTTCEEAARSSETVDLLRRLGTKDDEGERCTGETRADSYVAAYRNLTAHSTQTHNRPRSRRESERRQVSRVKRALPIVPESTASRSSSPSTVVSRNSRETITERDSQTSSSYTIREHSQEREAQSMANSYAHLVGKMPETQSQLSLYSENGPIQSGRRPFSPTRSSQGSRASSRVTTDSWAVFNKSPLGKGRPISSTHSVGVSVVPKRPSIQAQRTRSCAA